MKMMSVYCSAANIQVHFRLDLIMEANRGSMFLVHIVCHKTTKEDKQMRQQMAKVVTGG